MLEKSVPLPIAVFVAILPLPRPTVSQCIFASAVVMIEPVLAAPIFAIRNASILFLRKTTSMLSVVPRKFVSADSPALPRRDQPPPPAEAHIHLRFVLSHERVCPFVQAVPFGR